MGRATPQPGRRVENALGDWRAADRKLADARARREAIDQATSGSSDETAMTALKDAILQEQSALIAAEEARARFQEAREQALEQVERTGAEAELAEPCT